MNLHPDIQKQVNRWKLRELEIEALSCEVIEVDYLDMPQDDTEGAFYRDITLDKLLHADEWEDIEGDFNRIPAILRRQAL